MRIVYARRALQDLKKLDKETTRRIVSKVKQYGAGNNPLRFAKKLKPPFDDLYRFRIGDYRVIFEMNQGGFITLLVVLRVKHRKDVYE